MLNVDYLDGKWEWVSTLVRYYQVTNNQGLGRDLCSLSQPNPVE